MSVATHSPPPQSINRLAAPTRCLAVALSLCMAVIGAARAIGGAYYMNTHEARTSLARGEISKHAFAVAAQQLQASSHWWPYDARVWDAYGALSLATAYTENGRIQPDTAYPALSAYRNAVSLAPGQPLFWMRRAAGEDAAGNRNAALQSLTTSLATGAYHPLALQFRFKLGAQLWPDAPDKLRADIASQGAAALRQGRRELKYVAKVLDEAPPSWREALQDKTFASLTLQEEQDISKLLAHR